MALGSSVLLLLSSVSVATSRGMDPCGMVPPIYTGPGSPIVRTGLQQTYVFYKDGVETFVIRPGFQGKVDNFGMLIPFPNPPALRKVSDNIFQQIANAVDPPEVVVDLRIRRAGVGGADGFGGGGGGLMFKAEQVDEDKVAVLKEEAVGMYEVAVLQAGSPKALKLWMDEHKYQYPKGMDKVTAEYIKMNWCFVAVKTKVGSKGAVDPKPGLRSVNPNLPDGSVFDGNVQGMGFRFKSQELVVPMRLSAFNAGELRNVVYLLTDHPKRIRSIPEEYVVRQVNGKQLIKNLTQPLPLRVIGGSLKDIPEWRNNNLKNERDPKPHNGVARQLFAADLLAISSGQLSLEHEEAEKELLRIGEHFGLRGPENDSNIALATADEADKATQNSFQQLAKMTLTVVDGDFPRDVLARENLTFQAFNMSPQRNKRDVYDTKLHAAPKNMPGRLYSQVTIPETIHSENVANAPSKIAGIGSIAILVGMGGWITGFPRRRLKSRLCIRR